MANCDCWKCKDAARRLTEADLSKAQVEDAGTSMDPLHRRIRDLNQIRPLNPPALEQHMDPLHRRDSKPSIPRAFPNRPMAEAQMDPLQRRAAHETRLIDAVVDPDVKLILSDLARDPMYIRAVHLTLYDGRPRVADDADFAMALWKLRYQGMVEWGTGRPTRHLTELGIRTAEHYIASPYA